MTSIQKWLGGLLVIVAVGVVVWFAKVPPVPTIAPECPLDSIRLINRRTQKVTTLPGLTLSKFQTTVPEFNDCQQLLPGTSASYGPLVGVFAAVRLDSVLAHMYRLADSGAAVRAVSVAELVDWGPGDYPQLGISRQGDGINCLYMWVSTDGGDSLRAFMLPVKAEPDCQQDLNPEPLPTGAKRLRVAPYRPQPEYARVDYPEAARWDWDSRARHQYIGIGCDSAWCEIGGQGSKNYDDVAANANKLKRRRLFQIKGWYDEEQLAVSQTGAGLAPSGVVATIIPSDTLAYIKDDMANFENKWPVVARIALSGPLPAYQTKLNLVGGSVAAHVFNAVALCMGDRADCKIPAVVSDECHKLDADPDPHHKWWATVTSQAHPSTTEYRCVVRRTHPGVIIPAMVRWRWKTTDQNAWIPCPTGCCEVTDEN